MLSSLLGCGDASDSSHAAEPYEHVYTVRGKVVSMPEVSDASGDTGNSGGGGAFMVHHEAIPEYVSINGERGMNQMVMQFAVPDPSVLQGIAKGDLVEIVYGESFRPRVRQGVIAVKVLPADTQLNLGSTQPRPDLSPETTPSPEPE